jgi:hypothetical protein
MFVFHRSALAVLAPIALLMAVVLWSSHDSRPARTPVTAAQPGPEPQGPVVRVTQLRERER